MSVKGQIIMRNFFKFLWPSRNTYLSVTKLPHKLGISLLLRYYGTRHSHSP